MVGTKRTVTFDIEARGAEDPLYDKDGNPHLFSVVYSDLDREDVYAIANIQAVREYLENKDE